MAWINPFPKEDIIKAWNELWWKDRFYAHIEGREIRQEELGNTKLFKCVLLKAIREVVNSTKEKINNALLNWALFYIPSKDLDVSKFYTKLSLGLLCRENSYEEEVLLALGETRDDVDKILAYFWIEKHEEKVEKRIELTRESVLSAWTKDWWKDKFEQKLSEWMSFSYALHASAKELPIWHDIQKVASETRNLWGFHDRISRALGNKIRLVKNTLLSLYDNSEVDVNKILEKSETNNRNRKGKRRKAF